MFLVGVYLSLHLENTVSTTEVADFSPVTHINFYAYIMFISSKIHHFICSVPGTVSFTYKILCAIIKIYLEGKHLKGSYSTVLGASFFFLNLAGTMLPGIICNSLWTQPRHLRNLAKRTPSTPMQSAATTINAQDGCIKTRGDSKQRHEIDDKNQVPKYGRKK